MPPSIARKEAAGSGAKYYSCPAFIPLENNNLGINLNNSITINFIMHGERRRLTNKG